MGATTKKMLNTFQFSKDYSVKPWGLRWRSNTLFIVATVGIGLFTDLFLYGLIVPVLPSILQDRVGVPQDQVQRNTSGLLAAYAAASFVTSPIAGIMADRISTRQAPFLLGLTALLFATILLFVGTTIPVLVVARVLQGISAAFVWTIGLALCLETVGPENLGKTIGSVCTSSKSLSERDLQTIPDLFLHLRREPLRSLAGRRAIREGRLSWRFRHCIRHLDR